MRRGLGRARSGLIAALDVGSSKICCFIAEAQPRGMPRVLGIGQQASRGVRGGAVIDMAATEGAIRSAVHAAEQMSGQTIDQVVVNLSGGKPTSASVGIELALNGHAVGDGDLRRAFEHGHQAQGAGDTGAGGRQLIHSIPVGYRIDGSRGIRDPRGMVGEQLGVTLHLVTAANGPVRNLTTCIEHCHLDVAGFVVSPLASALSALVEDERDLGATLIDMGGGTTSIAVFVEGQAAFTEVIPVGGIHVTNDIARGLATSVAHAERLKTLYGHAMATSADQRETIDVPQVGEDSDRQARQVPRALLVGIIQPRLEETFELARSHLEASGFDRLAGRRVVLTGGASQLSGVPELASLILDKQVRIGRPVRVAGLAEATAGPAYATCAGLLLHAEAGEKSAPLSVPTQITEPAWLIDRVGHWLREHF